MIDANGELGRILEGAPEGVTGVPPGFDTLASHYRRGLTTAVVGRPGVGRDTMARAVRRRLSVTTLGPGEDAAALVDADLWLYVLTGVPRADDHRLLDQLPRERTIVVLGKADTHDDPETAAAVAVAAAEMIGMPVTPVSGLLACADVTDEEWGFLTELDASGESMPSMAGRFLVGAPGSRERRMRHGLLRRLGRFGVDAALTCLADGTVDDATSLNTVLTAISGIEALPSRIAGCVAAVRGERESDVRAELERWAAEGTERDIAERLLRLSEVVVG
ncbi:hypothetical protein [Gordonia sp. NPDC003376]